MQNHLDELLLQYTENHPDVINTRLIIEQLEEKKLKEQETKMDTGETKVTNDVLNLPLYQELNVILGQAQAEAAALNTRIKQFEKKKIEQKKTLKLMSEVEAELANLNRDYAINKKMYNDLVVRRESSKLSASSIAVFSKNKTTNNCSRDGGKSRNSKILC